MNEDEIMMDLGNEVNIPQPIHSHPGEHEMQKLVHITLLFLLLWSSRYGISRNALDHLVQYLKYLFSSLGPYMPFAIANIIACFPTSIYTLRKLFSLHQDKFKKFTVCSACHSIYEFENCFSTSPSGVQTPRLCSFIAFPNHPYQSRRKHCGHALVKEVVLNSGAKLLYPIKVYCFKSIKESISSVLSRKEMLELCEQWRSRQVPSGYLADVYDGRVWNEFIEYQGKPFLRLPHNLGLMLNCDWFQPYDCTEYSVGVIYLVILNLPRTERFKPENVILVGIIPGPDEPPLHINSYLQPIISDLIDLWNDGISLTVGDTQKTIHAALLCVACDLPAARKVEPFLSFSLFSLYQVFSS